MPTISAFYGILIRMYWNEHAPPHFHAIYNENEILINIKTLEIIDGNMPNRALSLVLEWSFNNRDELLENWELCQKNQHPHKIDPLL